MASNKLYNISVHDMELNSIRKDKKQTEKEESRDSEPVYLNTTLSQAQISEEDESDYEVLKRISALVQNSQLPPATQFKESSVIPKNSNRFTLLVYTLLGCVITLFLAVSGTAIALGVTVSQTRAIHGGWTEWSGWGQCSATCNTGLETRNRSCLNPRPSDGGNHCYGESVDIRLCNNAICEGTWGAWQAWTQCSASCGFGLTLRNKTCSPDKHCVGDSTEYKICKDVPCPDGGWTTWAPWSTCSLSCGGGLQFRSRSCTNPAPSVDGQFCVGDSMQIQTCNSNKCPTPVSAFTVDTPSVFVNNSLTFSHVVYQQEADFNGSTGIFTCSIPGTYLFSVNLVKKRTGGRTYDVVRCYLYRNNEVTAVTFIDPSDDNSADSGSAGVSSTVVVRLNRNDNVYLAACSVTESMEARSNFAGVLLHPDD